MRTRLFKIAHAIKGQFASFGEALAHAWKVVKLQYALTSKALINFSYKKVDGTIREAVGTLLNAPTPKGGLRKPSFNLLTYFDLQQNDWRCAKVENLIF